jgi:two-component system cell cycle sensor histidine kinase/response regulator CckA
MSAVTKIRWPASDLKAEPDPLFECAPVGIARFRLDGSVDEFNPALERMMAQKSESDFGNGSKMGLRFPDLVHPRLEGERLLGEFAAGERHSFQIGSVLSDEDGRPTQWTAWRIPGANGEDDHAIAFTQTLARNSADDERQRHTERLEVLGRLASGVAHDFNNLLTGVLLYSDLLTATLEPGARAHKYAEEIRKAGIQATGLVKQLLAVARPAKLELRLLSLNEMAEGMRNLLLRLIGENIELRLDLDPNLGLVKMDATQAQQILLNLVLNSRDAMPSGGQISVSTSNCRMQILRQPSANELDVEGKRPDLSSPENDDLLLPCALLVVRDNGQGMDAQTRAHLFEAFFTTKSAGKGTGLGLATVYDIVTGIGGLIHVDSLPGCGTRFSVLLPLVPQAVLGSTPMGTPKIEGEFSAAKQ